MMPESRSAHWLSDDFTSLVGQLLELALRRGIPLLSIAFSWLLAREEVASVIAGASNAEQVKANAAAPVELDDDLLTVLDELTLQKD
jgi:aryl-alcohol dehydrogenase-like predicted oxidoreductase